MGLKKTRTILSVILAAVIALSTVVMLSALAANMTFASPEFIQKYMITDEAAAECEAQLSNKFEVLEKETGIPERVFESYKNDSSIKESMAVALQNVFGEESSTLYNEEKVEYFYSKCTEYLDAKGVKYNEKNVKLAAEKAARIYSECVGIHNVDSLKNKLSKLKQSCARFGSAALLVLIICVIMLVVLYRKIQFAYSYLAGGLIGGGIAGVLASATCIILKVGRGLSYTPEVYQQSIGVMAENFFVALLLASMVILIIGAGIDAVLMKNINSQSHRNATRFSKIIGKF